MLFERKVTENGVFAPNELTMIQARVDERISSALKFAQESPEPAASELFADLYV
jgi:TPP-dependent pyruvate/acetoin dehydrogenase alpha subunit